MSKPAASIERARRLRRTMSPREAKLWRYLRGRPGGFKFRRQHPSDPFDLDFFCYESGVAIEVDGDAHAMGDRPQRDERRDAMMAGRNVLTLRFLAADVMNNLEGVAAQIEQVCRSRSPN